MSKNVTLWGASYSDVPSIEVPSTGGGVAAFHDVSDTTAVASDVAIGKLFHDANGALTAGTGSSTTVEPLSVTQNGTYTAPTGTAYSPVTVNVSGGGGISVDDLATNTAPSGVVTLSNSVTAIGEYAFAGKPITSIIAPSVTDMGAYTFQNTQITSITDANFPMLGVNTRYTGYIRCNSLTSIKLTGEKIALSSGYGMLRDNPNLVSAEFPNAAKDAGASNIGMGNAAFYGDTNLELLDIGYCQSFSNNCFCNVKKRLTIIARYEGIVKLGNTSWFNNSALSNGGNGATIYIPKSLYDHLGDGTALDYKNATNWSVIDGYGTITWAQIEGSIYEIPQGGTA